MACPCLRRAADEALALFNDQRFDEAKRLYEHAFQLDPSSSDVALHLVCAPTLVHIPDGGWKLQGTGLTMGWAGSSLCWLFFNAHCVP